MHAHTGHKAEARKQVFSKMLRWSLPNGETHKPATVEVVGTFTEWKRTPMARDHSGQGWHLMLHQMPCNRTHHYMFLADGKPVQDKHCDGLAVPHGAQEEQYAISTPRGPRVFMLFAQTK